MKIIVIESPCKHEHTGACDGMDYGEHVAYIPCCQRIKQLLEKDSPISFHAGLCAGTPAIHAREVSRGVTGFGDVRFCLFCGTKIEQIVICALKREALSFISSSEEWDARFGGRTVAEVRHK